MLHFKLDCKLCGHSLCMYLKLHNSTTWKTNLNDLEYAALIMTNENLLDYVELKDGISETHLLWIITNYC